MNLCTFTPQLCKLTIPPSTEIGQCRPFPITSGLRAAICDILHHDSTSLASRQVHVEKSRSPQRIARRGLAVVSVAGVAALSLATWQSYQTSKREAAIFASLSASAFAQHFCDRALRLAAAGLPPSEGAFPTSYRSLQLQGELAYFASSPDCKFRAALIGHADLVDSVVFSPDGSRIMTASWDGTARLWDTKTGAALTTFSGHTTWLNSAQFSRDGRRIVTASSDKT